jgi:hypothetical protein
MSTYEDPVTTVIRLLTKKTQVIKDDDSIASIYVSKEWYDRELFKNYDAQISVGLAQSQDQMLEISGRLHRRLGRLRVNVWATDKASSSDTGREMREKIVEQVNAVVRQNMKIPNQALYDFSGEGYPTGTPHKAFSVAAASELSPSDMSWVELTNLQYQDIWHADGTDYSLSTLVNGAYALMLFRFQIDTLPPAVQQIVLTFLGYGSAPAGYGSTIKIWNAVAGAWQNPSTGSGSADEYVTITVASNVANYIDSNGYIWLLVHTTNPSNGSTAAVINCDYVSCMVTIKGITYLNVDSFRDVDKVDVKPFIFRTEFILKSWSFEDIGGVF